MAKEREDLKLQDLQNHHELDEKPSTPPYYSTLLPPTPPATGERGRRTLDMSGVGGALSVPNNIQHPKLERRLRRFDFEPGTGLLTVRMPSPVHDIFSAQLAGEVHDWLKSITSCGGESGAFASKIVSGVRRQPDAQFQHEDAAYPGLVIEVSYSQDGKNLRKLAQDYILYSNGDIKTVVGIDINYGERESTVSVWRPNYSDDKDQISSSHESVCFSISFKRLSDLLGKAEQMQKVREPTGGQGGIKSTRKTKKRKLSSSPVDELIPEDEENFLVREIEVLRRAEQADKDFKEPAAKRRDAGSRHEQG
ncbi:hypothetical protein TrVFT333_006434 [Trichoderma virens FT-333]|nr:hypothetical protein TrVFT333_006434 [Trichoderma virens FT-333]